MTSPWPPERIAAVAPEPSSMTAARGLGSAWNGTGRNDRALWGECRGRGTAVYRTAIDLDGPSYRCSCPSRKFPCKHALALLMRWSEGAIAESAPPDSVTEWLAARTAEAAPANEAPGEPAKTPDPATVRRRAERAAAGLDDLDRWLTDRIRSGLGSVDHSCSTYDDMAARMVDAQVPGIASALRGLAGVVATEVDWPARVLAEYARLHLLVVAYRKIDDLPGPLARSVHTHLGFPTRADDVRSEPAVRDRWQVLATRISEDSRLFTRKVWLRGRDTGRWAIVLDFAHGTARFPVETPPPGMLVDADLHFYPGAAPLRALAGTRHSVPEPFTTLPASLPGTAPDFDAALDEYARVLGADPWIRSWPMLLDSVVPVESSGAWHLVDRHGRALPLGGEDDTRWRLVAVAGGQPLTVCGDWDGTRLAPASLFTAGQEVSL
ncbi:SWIM zinc finger family protein [Rhodococcus coprophilus]|nr:SWIM zinc finger family protein [Rhodococcus coprophilus]MBM7460569.1 hypothetical protein [Rhodococcus coprophilus]